MGLPKEYISYSQVRLYQSCPKKYYYTYVKKIPVSINDKIFLGIVFHAAVEYYFNEKIKNAEPGNEKVLEYFTGEFDTLQKKREILWGISTKETRKRGIAFVRYFLKEVVPPIEPLMVEKELWADLPGIGVKLKGVIDLVEKDFSITDFKTTTAKWSKTKVKSSYLQMLIYRYLFEQSFGDVISQLKFKIIYSKNSSHIKHQEVAIKAKDVEYSKMFDIIKYVVENIKQGVFYKNENFTCGFCEYKDICRSGREE